MVLGNSLALYNPPVRVAEEFAMLDVSEWRPARGWLPSRHLHGHRIFAYGQIPATLREKYLEAHDLVIKAWTERKPFPFNGKYTQHTLRRHLAPSLPATAHPPDMGARLR